MGNEYIAFASGGRKESSATVWLKKGEGNIIINGREIEKYFGRQDYIFEIKKVLEKLPPDIKYDVIAKVTGGGTTGQFEAIRLALAKSIALAHPDLKTILKKEKLLTRDSRIVERKKYGHPKARKRFQWTKR